jgi:hypothetical protein
MDVRAPLPHNKELRNYNYSSFLLATRNEVSLLFIKGQEIV